MIIFPNGLIKLFTTFCEFLTFFKKLKHFFTIVVHMMFGSSFAINILGKKKEKLKGNILWISIDYSYIVHFVSSNLCYETH